jgi:hypothetical protein
MFHFQGVIGWAGRGDDAQGSPRRQGERFYHLHFPHYLFFNVYLLIYVPAAETSNMGFLLPLITVMYNMGYCYQSRLNKYGTAEAIPANDKKWAVMM